MGSTSEASPSPTRRAFTFVDFLYTNVIACVGAAGAQSGFVGLLCALAIGYVMLCVLDFALTALALSPSEREAIRRSSDALATRPWLLHFPACDIRDLYGYWGYYFMAETAISFFAFMGYAGGPEQLNVLRFLGCVCAAVLGTALGVAGLSVLWVWTVSKLGATEHASSSLSKPVEILVCHALLMAGWLWIAIATWIPIWIASWFLGWGS